MMQPWLWGMFLCWVTTILGTATNTVAATSFVQPPQFVRRSPRSEQEILRKHYDGPESVAVRNAVEALENRMPIFQTGVLGNPHHKVDYHNHPYDKSTRHLQQSNNTDNFQPMRISFYTKALDDIRDGTNAAKIDWYKSQILPITAAFWTSTLSVIPVKNSLLIASSELDGFAYCGHRNFTRVPNEHKSSGVANTDLVLYVSGSASPSFCPARTLAVAVPCNHDQFSRPTAGAINVCLDNIKLKSDGTASTEVLQDYIDVTIHEVGHVLGHSSNSYKLYYDPDTGNPRTSRPFSDRTVKCVNGKTESLVLPSENTMEFTTDSQGNAVASIVTPKVRQVARNQFNCQRLNGAQLENQPTRSESCTGDHWDERLYYPEAMSGVISPTTNILSSLTLALMEDSGWYKANYTNTRMSPWGLGVGCDFVEQPCLSTQSGQTEIPDFGRGFFCTDANSKGCSSEHTHKLACSMYNYNNYSPDSLPEPQYQYFPDNPAMGGPRQADFCPVYGQTYDTLISAELDCTDGSNSPALNVYSEVYGKESQCITSTAGTGLCYETACIKKDMTLRINVLGEWHTCDEDFQEISITVGQGLVRTKIICPRLTQACPDLFCPFNCAGRGVCDYTNMVNGTLRPKCNCFDTSDTSDACSDSLIPDGKFLEDGNGLFDNLQENFFDPLIQVFVDHPDAWTPAAWAWAGGLMAVFLILLLCICSSVCPQRKRKI